MNNPTSKKLQWQLELEKINATAQVESDALREKLKDPGYAQEMWKNREQIAAREEEERNNEIIHVLEILTKRSKQLEILTNRYRQLKPWTNKKQQLYDELMNNLHFVSV